MKEQGITDVIATPHFYAASDNLEEYTERVRHAFDSLSMAVRGRELPNIFMGCEVLYYYNIGASNSVYGFTLSNTPYLLLELTDGCINSDLFADITALRDKIGVTPIIAHIERYFRSPAYNKLLKYIKKEKILTQLNASSLFSETYRKTAEKLIKKDYVNFIATDAHSSAGRPPMMKQAFKIISEKFGSHYSSKFIRNSQILLEEINED